MMHCKRIDLNVYAIAADNLRFYTCAIELNTAIRKVTQRLVAAHFSPNLVFVCFLLYDLILYVPSMIFQ